jgi:hypothetical protein
MPTLSIKDMPRNEEMDSNDMAAIEGGISFPSVFNGLPVIKLIAPPQPVTKPNTGLPANGDSGGYSLNFGGDDGSGYHQD